MTGAWELALAAIEAGKIPSDKFSQGINSYVETICEELLSLSSVAEVLILSTTVQSADSRVSASMPR